MRRVTASRVPIESGAVPVWASDPVSSEACGDRCGLPWVLVVPSIFGVDSALRVQLSELGEHARVVALDPFHRSHPGPLPYIDIEVALARMEQTRTDEVHADVSALAAILRPTGPVVGLGICYGGPFVIQLAAEGVLDGVACWHPSRLGNVLEAAGTVVERGVPIRLHCGAGDPFTSPELLASLRVSLGHRAADHLVVHEGAGHGFSQRGGPQYQAVAERAGLESVVGIVNQLAAGGLGR